MSAGFDTGSSGRPRFEALDALRGIAALGVAWGHFHGADTLFLMQNVGLTPPGPSWHAPSWSISVEFYAPLFLFFWIGLWRDNRNTSFVGPTLVLALICVLAVVNGEGSLAVGGHDILPWVNYGLMRGLSEVAVGVLAYRVFVAIGRRIETSLATGTLVEVALVVLCCLLLFRRPFVSHEDIFVIPLFATLIFWLAIPRGGVALLLETRPLRWLGQLSYSIYINHYLVLLVLPMLALNPRWAGWLYFCVVIALSWVTWRWIEVPARRTINRGLSPYVR